MLTSILIIETSIIAISIKRLPTIVIFICYYYYIIGYSLSKIEVVLQNL
jgi:hypothetical protein